MKNGDLNRKTLGIEPSNPEWCWVVTIRPDLSRWFIFVEPGQVREALVNSSHESRQIPNSIEELLVESLFLLLKCSCFVDSFIIIYIIVLLIFFKSTNLSLSFQAPLQHSASPSTSNVRVKQKSGIIVTVVNPTINHPGHSSIGGLWNWVGPTAVWGKSSTHQVRDYI